MQPSELNFSMYSGFSEAVQAFGIEKAAKIAAESGYRSVEFLALASKYPPRELFRTPKEIARMRKVLDAYGLSVACFSVGIGLWQPAITEETARIREERVIALAEIAAALGSPFLHHTLVTTQSCDTPYDEVLEYVLPIALRIARRADEIGLTVLYEPQGMYFNGCTGFRGFYRRMKAEHPSVGVCGDVGNTLCVNEDPISFFRTFAKDVRHVHLKDFAAVTDATQTSRGYRSRNGVYLRETVVGEGDIDLTACLTVLRDAGYRGAFAIEHDELASLWASKRITEAVFCS